MQTYAQAFAGSMPCHSHPQGGPSESQVSQPHVDPWEGDGAANAGNNFQA